jgi:hypothetical protein
MPTMFHQCNDRYVWPFGLRERRREVLYILRLIMITSEKGVVTHAYTRKRGWSYTCHRRAYHTIVPQGVPTHSHTILTTMPLHCPPLSETPPSHLTNKTGLPKHSNSDSTQNIILHHIHSRLLKHTTHSPPSLSRLQHSSILFPCTVPSAGLNSILLRHCYL